MKRPLRPRRPLRTVLADALHLRERKEHGDGRRYGHRQPATGRGTGARPPRCGSEPCGLDPLWTAEYGGVRADRRRIDYRTPAGDDPCPGTGAAASGRPGEDCGGPGEDTLFLFLKSLHRFLTAPQDAATAGTALPGPSSAAGTTAAAERPDHRAAPPEHRTAPGRTGRSPYDGTP
ncbi:hypothetical protein ACIQ9E_15235 [Streptomyces sp. NPDC094448]|uniref:hypothetical protein n=1 Tax=Streptomyces sp. NPDC094448 TaxID=3366063 RepID=UPI0038213014